MTFIIFCKTIKHTCTMFIIISNFYTDQKLKMYTYSITYVYKYKFVINKTSHYAFINFFFFLKNEKEICHNICKIHPIFIYIF